MKIELGNQKPDNFIATWDGEYDLFSHFEFACSIPQLMFAVTTVKENGQPNVCLHSWSTFSGDGKAYHAILSGLSQHTHTYKNIARTGEFVVNFLSQDAYNGLMATIHNHSEDADEFEVGGFTQEKAVTVSCPRIKEAFLCLECKHTHTLDLSGAGRIALVAGIVEHIAVQEEYAQGIDERFGDNGFIFNVHCPKNLATGQGIASAVAVCKIVRRDAE